MSIPREMTAMIAADAGGPEALQPMVVSVPEPAADEVLIRVEASALNWADVLERRGDYPGWAPRPTNIIGLEVAGTIVALGDEVMGLALGDAVCALLTGGGYAPYCVAPALQVMPIPKGLSMEQAAALPEAYCTVWTNMMDRGDLKPGETILIHGGSSGIGTTAIDMAKAFGARVIITAGTDEKCQACRDIGADVAINYRTEDFVERVMDATLGEGVEIVLDMVGGDYFERDMDVLKVEGRLISIGTMQSMETAFSLAPLLVKRLTLTGSTLRPRTPEQKREIMDALEHEVWPKLEAGQMKPVVDSTWPLEEVAKAHERLEASQQIGKIVLTVSHEGG
jgi:NADPH2:quinone reductase